VTAAPYASGVGRATEQARARSPRQSVERTDLSPVGRVRRLRFDVQVRPFLVLFELTRACDLACLHCRAEAVPRRHREELTTAEARAVLDDLAQLGPPRPVVVFTGGDPLQRPDLAALVRHASRAGLAAAVSPAGTPRATKGRLSALRAAGVRTVSFSLDGSSASVHDGFRQVAGSFAWTLAACRSARSAGLRLQVNTTVSRETVLELPGICRLVAELGADLWSVFFLVPTGRGRVLQALSARETEDVLAILYDAAAFVPLKTTEAPAFRRLVLRGGPATGGLPPGPLYRALRRRFDRIIAEGFAGNGHATRTRSPLALGDGRGVVFVSHRGDVQPSGFLPLVAGNVRQATLSSIYACSPLLRTMRDPAALQGRCGRCELREVCGGSRAQAFARLGDPLGEDPTCPYEPPPPARVGAGSGR